MCGLCVREYMLSREHITTLKELNAVENIKLMRNMEAYYSFLESHNKKSKNDKAILLHLIDRLDNQIHFKSITFSDDGFTIEAEVYNIDSWTQYMSQLRYALKGISLHEHKQANMASKATDISVVGSFK